MPRTWVAVLTGEGLGAVAVLRVWGARTIEVVDSAFRPYRDIRFAESQIGQPRLGRIGAGDGDEVVAIVMPGEAVEVEVHCHGGPAAVSLVVDGLVAAGASSVKPARWVRHSSGSRLCAEALEDLPEAMTLRAASHLLDQSNGALDRELEGIRDELGQDPRSACSRIERLLALAPIGTRLVSGWRVVLAGRPNVGKSRLLNALAGFDRAIVDPTPGTTRDIVTLRTAFDGWPVELSDTAGLRETDDPIEAAGVHLALDRQRSADLVVLVLDLSEPLNSDDRRLLEQHPDAIVVANKCDLRPSWEFAGLTVSAELGTGLERLTAEVGRRVMPVSPAEGTPLPFRFRHVRRLNLIRLALEQRREEWVRRVLCRWLGNLSQ